MAITPVVDAGGDADAVIKYLYEHQPDKCFLCSGQAVVIGVYIADNPESVGAPPGKDRIISYGLCENHPPSPLVAEMVEKGLKSSFRLN